jgi:uncharacterized protein YchJ
VLVLQQEDHSVAEFRGMSADQVFKHFATLNYLLHKLSCFVREGGKWLYIDGQMMTAESADS